MEYSKKNKKINFLNKKKLCVIKYLNQVNCFLINFSKIYNIKKIIKSKF